MLLLLLTLLVLLLTLLVLTLLLALLVLLLLLTPQNPGSALHPRAGANTGAPRPRHALPRHPQLGARATSARARGAAGARGAG